MFECPIRTRFCGRVGLKNPARPQNPHVRPETKLKQSPRNPKPTSGDTKTHESQPN